MQAANQVSQRVMHLSLSGLLKKLTDPSTNEVLMIKKKPLGMVRIKRVMKKISIGEFSPMDVVKPKRGDLVVGVEK